MSRCFPYPPPGYEAGPKSEQQHKDLLKKEKHKEKHKREKDRGKRERKEKEKDRDHRKDKHSKKHKGEKHRGSRNNEDRDKYKKQSLGPGTQKNCKLGNRKPGERGQNDAVKDIKPKDELVTQTFGQEANANHKYDNTRSLLPQSTDSIGATGSKEKERNSVGRMVKKSVEATHENHGMVKKSNDSMVHANRKGMCRGVDSKAKIKNGKSLQVGSAEMHSKRKHGCKGVDVQHDNSIAQRSSEDVHTANPVLSDARREANGRMTPNPNTLQKGEEMQPGPEISVHLAKGENDRISTKDGMKRKENQSANKRRDKMNQKFIRKKDGEVEGKAKTKAVEGKDRDNRVLKKKTEYKNKEKEMKKNGFVNEHKHEDLGVRNNKDGNLMDLGFHNEKLAPDNIKKRKNFSSNNSLHEHNMKTTKLPRVSPTKNEEICWHSQQISPYSSTELFGANACEIGCDKPQDGYNNGTTGSHSSEEDIASVASSGYRSNKVCLKQPHPDTKYLSQLYSLPPAQDFSYYIDQDWLFSKDRVERKTAAFEDAESGEVWSDAQLIDTADVIALPYVVPL